MEIAFWFFDLLWSIVHGLSSNPKILYIYTSQGQKIMQQVRDDGNMGETRRYAGAFVYLNDQLAWVNTANGRFVPAETEEFAHETHLKDHLGNTRVVLTQDGEGFKILQDNSYYPFGMSIKSMSYTSSLPGPLGQNRYLYNGKEFQPEFGLDWLDYGARFYDPSLGRFTTPDPHAESYLNWTPFNYVANNPINMIDPDGKDWYRDKDGNTRWQKGSDAIEGYQNIGANYSYRQGDVTFSYEQNDLVTLEEHVLNAGDWITSLTTNADGSQKQCFTAAKEMVSKSGAEMSGSDNKIITGTESKTKDGHKITATKDASAGVDYINSQVDQGKSTGVGVDYAFGKNINDKTTDHWVAISSRVTDLKNGTVSFKFFDPGTSRPAHGRSGVLNINSSGLLTGTGKIANSPGYTVTQVRKNK